MAEIKTSTITLTRANRIAIQTTEAGFKADFYRTHKHLATMLSEETGWEADQTMNKSAQREDFRKFAIDHAGDIGIEWKPQDLRTEENKRIPKYESDELLMADAKDMLYGDVMELVAKCPHGASFISLEAETIVAVTHSAKGTDLTKLGVIGGKYEKSGNWAWADVEMLVTLTKGGEFIYYTTKMQLVSGQLKKPHITQTAFNDSIKESMKEAGIWVEEAKADAKTAKVEDTKVEETQTEEVKEEAQAEDAKPAKKTRKSTKKSKTETTKA